MQMSANCLEPWHHQSGFPALQEAHATTKGARELLALTLKDVETNVRITQLARTKAALVRALDILMALHQASTLQAALRYACCMLHEDSCCKPAISKSSEHDSQGSYRSASVHCKRSSQQLRESEYFGCHAYTTMPAGARQLILMQQCMQGSYSES